SCPANNNQGRTHFVRPFLMILIRYSITCTRPVARYKMKKVLVFFNAQPVEVVQTVRAVTTLLRNYPNGEEIHLKIMRVGTHSITGDHTEIYVASDRELSTEEIISAANRLL
ncbi:hypothetical protein, partial [Leptospira interrogans]|uniref:hypothetical protein n=1 Tax=Leptospira interrogans TaxID=173 RepID=UPI004036700C